jgi:hypothetical protein
MVTIKRSAAWAAIGVLAVFMFGCGNEGPLGNTPPQGRPEWMKKDNPPAQPEQPKKE